MRAQRSWNAFLARGNRPPPGTLHAPVVVDGVPADRLQHPGGSGESALVYLHGGGYVAGSPRVQGVIPAHLVHATGAIAYVPDYRLAPEHPFPAALEDTLCVYRWLLDRGADPSTVALAGDSAGGGLALAAALAARDEGLPLPARLVLISPWVDLTLSGDSVAGAHAADAMLTRAWLEFCARAYLDGRHADDFACSPLFADLSGLPPILIQVGTREILISDAERLADRARAAGVETRLSRYEGQGHAFQLHAGALRTSDAAIEELARFLGANG